MAYSCDGFGICEARSIVPGQEGTTLFSRTIRSDASGTPAPTTNVSSWSNQCGATNLFPTIAETTGDVTGSAATGVSDGGGAAGGG